jgi:hypothetical protein
LEGGSEDVGGHDWIADCGFGIADWRMDFRCRSRFDREWWRGGRVR